MVHEAIEVDGLQKTYRNGHRALRGVDLQVRWGETFVLLGPNGAGKSTLVEILEGYRNRSAGSVRVLGADPAQGDLRWRSRIGIVLQEAGQAAGTRVRELVAHAATCYPDPRDVDEVLAAVGLEQRAGAMVRSLSGGQRRRVDVALAVVGRPELLFLDEPTTGLDPVARRQFWSYVRTLQQESTTIVLTTHDLQEATELADRAAVLVDGRVAALGPLAELGGDSGALPLVRWRDDGGWREERTAAPGRFVAELAVGGGEPPGLEIRRPGLAEVYLELVGSGGSSARDAQAAAEVAR